MKLPTVKKYLKKITFSEHFICLSDKNTASASSTLDDIDTHEFETDNIKGTVIMLYMLR